jgi:uncharacterized membrane protein YagU involved in acid resistance
MLRTIAIAGTICGILDGLSAILLFGWLGATPAQVFQGIARGVMGRAALTGGATAVIVGVLAHFTVAFGAAAVYYAATRVWPKIIERPLVFGPLYGAGVHLFMSFVVIPLSAIGPRPIIWRTFLEVLAIHLVVVGPSISLTVSRRESRLFAPTGR